LLEPDSDQTQALRALLRAREDLVGARVAATNQLQRFWPGPIGLFFDLDSPTSLAFLARYPSPVDARRLGEKRMAAFLTAQHHSGHKPTANLLARLRSAPVRRAGDVETRARRSIVLGLVQALQIIVEQIAGSSQRSPKRSTSAPMGRPSAASDCRPRYPHRDAIAADGGQAPVADESGQRTHAKFPWVGRPRFGRHALIFRPLNAASVAA
jgi:hypothetical protein